MRHAIFSFCNISWLSTSAFCWCRRWGIKTTIIFGAMVLNPLFATAAFISPSIELTDAYLITSLSARTSSLYCYPGTCSSLYENNHPTNPDINAINITRNQATDPYYGVEASSVGVHGATSYADAFGNFVSIATVDIGNNFQWFVRNEVTAGARVNGVYYECGTEQQPHTCFEGGVANAGAGSNFTVTFSLLQPFAYEFTGDATYSGILLFAYQGYDTYINWVPSADQSGTLSGILPAGSYQLQSYVNGVSVSAPSPEGHEGGFAGYSFQLNLTPLTVPAPPAVWLFGSGIAGLFSFARRRLI